MDVLELIERGYCPVALLDPRNDEPALEVSSIPREGTTFDRHHRLELLFRLPTLVEVDRLKEEIHAGRYEAEVQAIADGFEAVWNGRNYVGEYSPDAERAIGRLGKALEKAETYDVLADPPEDFAVTITADIPYGDMESFCNGLVSEAEYEEIMDRYVRLTREHFRAKFPTFRIRCSARRDLLPGKIIINAKVAHGGAEVAERVKEMAQEYAREIDWGELAEQATQEI